MAKQIIPAAQLVPNFQGIRRCNNYDMLQSIPCSPKYKIVGQILLDHSLSYVLTATGDVPAMYLQQFWKTVSKVPDTKDTIRFKLDTHDIVYTVDMFRATLQLPVETIDNPFFIPATIEIIQSFMQRVGYQGVVEKDFMNTIFQKKDVQYPRLTKFIIYDLMKKYPSIPQKHDEDYYSIKDDIPLESIRATDDYKEYETVFVNVSVLMNQPRVVVSTQGTHRDRIELGIHKEHPEVVVDDDDNKEEKKDEKEGDEMGSLEIRTKNIAIYDLIESNLKPIIAVTIIQDCDAFRSEVPTHISKEFDSHAPHIIEELFKNYVQNNIIQVHPTITTSTKTTSSADLQQQLYLKMKSNPQDQANDPALWDVLKHKFKKSSTSNTSCSDDEFHSQRHDDHHEDDAPPEGEKRVKRHKTFKSLKSARGSSSK
nr:hypothetical protein [Tanacetum cinerariifolium]